MLGYPAVTDPVVHYTQEFRAKLLATRDAPIFRKKARIVAVEMLVPFTVETDRGIMRGEAGDWLVTNHPADDPGSDLWTISAARMASAYEPVE